jgi:multidrug efflux system outer membrane protein
MNDVNVFSCSEGVSNPFRNGSSSAAASRLHPERFGRGWKPLPNRNGIGLTALFLSFVLSACAPDSAYRTPSFAFPERWPQRTEAKKEEARAPIAWHRSFNDPVLSALVEEGIRANDDLARAAAAVAEARAGLRLARADLYPALDATANASRTDGGKESAILPSKPYNEFGVAGVLSYEIDLWGKLRRARASARARLLSAHGARDAVRLAVAADIAAGYFNLRAIDGQIDATEETVASRKEAYDYQNSLYKSGAADVLTLSQAEAELADARAQMPALVQARREQESALAVLLGREPKEIVRGGVARGKATDATLDPAPLPPELPSSLLRRRPDVRATERALEAAHADVGVARTAYFPSLSLSAMLGLDSGHIDRLFRGSALGGRAGASLAAPLLNAGRTKAGVEAAEAAKAAALADYRKTVRIAFKEALDAIGAQGTAAERLEAETKHVRARREALRLADLRYKSGHSVYPEVLDSRRFLYQAELSRVRAKRDMLVARVNLYKALGGGAPK